MDRSSPEAIEILERGCKAIPDSTDLVSHLGRTYSAAGDYERVTAVLRQLIVRNPSQVEAYLPLAQAYESLGQVDRAIQVLQARNEFPPRDVMVSTAMAGFLFRKGEPSFEQVLAELEKGGADSGERSRYLVVARTGLSGSKTL